VRIAYETTGEGPPLVQAPTWLTHLELDWTSAAWRPWLETLSRGRRLVRYDLRGCGLSDGSAAELSLETFVADLEAVADAVGLETFPLIGLCQGGSVAAAFAARRPARVRRLVIHGSYVQGAFVAGNVSSPAAREAAALGELIESGWGREVPAFREVFACMLMPGAPPQATRALAEMERECAEPETAARLWTAFHRIDVRADAPLVRCPTLVLHARRDSMVPFNEGRRLAALIPGARFVALDGRNHILQPDEPAWGRFWQEAMDFLDGDGNANARDATFSDLTPREREVLDQIARGRSNAAIASHFSIAPKTVRNHVSNIFTKLAVHHRGEAVVRARDAGFGQG
jgi:pimeloyl-ACP methyl ester carboxylesterase/DNA-binding CsgD family transcriptional regulator